MVWPIRSKTRSVISSVAVLRTSVVNGDYFQCSPFSGLTNSFTGFPRICPIKLGKVYDTQLGLTSSLKRHPSLKLGASGTALALSQEGISHEVQNVAKTCAALDWFEEMKQRFLSFKKNKYLKKFEHFQKLAEAQSPKFMVIACADSRICPSIILGFQPGETLMIRNVANLVPPLEKGPSETNAALEFAVNTLEVENILIIGHSDCGGIQALMRMRDDTSSNFTEKWVLNAKIAKLRTKSDAAHLNFDQQCRHCEKESVNHSLLNLLTYPWIEDKVRKGSLSLHGGYYDLKNCTFEKWTLDYRESSLDEGDKCSIKDRSFWF